MLHDAFEHGIKKIVIACGKTDLRKGIDGLHGLIKVAYHLDPTEEGTLFLFCGASQRVIKGLYYDGGDGFLLLTKRLIDGKYRWPMHPGEVRFPTREQYASLMNNLKPVISPRTRKWSPIDEAASTQPEPVMDVPQGGESKESIA